MAKKSNPASPFEGRWRITSMEMWDQDFIDADVEGFFDFGPDGLGSFQFGYVSGDIDYRDSIRDGEPAIEGAWDGHDEMDAAQGRGWALLKGGELHGMIHFHGGDDSEFVAIRKPKR